jgi:predicted Zn-dependent protease
MNETDDDGWVTLTWSQPSQISRNYALAGYDRTHNFSMGFLYDLPFAKNDNGVLASIVQNWQVNGPSGLFLSNALYPAVMRFVRSLLVPVFLALALTGPASAAAQATKQTSPRANEAERAMNEGRFDAAASAYRELLKTHPDEPGLLANLGMALAMGGHADEAVAPLERALSLNPRLTNARVFLGSSYLATDQPKKAVAALKKAVSQQPSSLENRRRLAEAYAAADSPLDALTELRKITELAPRDPSGWFALGHAYNGFAQDAMATFNDRAEDLPWRQLLLADALAEDGRLVDAFALYRSTLEQLPAMVSIHDSIARIYEQTSHPNWATLERSKGTVPASACTTRKALCDFRAARYRAVLTNALAADDPESRYWSARAAAELARAAFKQLDTLPDSRERRLIRATFARGQRRYADAIKDLQAALKMSRGDPELLAELGTTYYFAREFDHAITTIEPLLKMRGNDPQLLSMYGEALLETQRVDDAIAALERVTSLDSTNSSARLALARAYVQKGYYQAAIPLIELEIPDDKDGSLHVQLARAYKGLGNADKAAELLARSEELQRAAQERSAAAGQRTITPPK